MYALSGRLCFLRISDCSGKQSELRTYFTHLLTYCYWEVGDGCFVRVIHVQDIMHARSTNWVLDLFLVDSYMITFYLNVGLSIFVAEHIC